MTYPKYILIITLTVTSLLIGVSCNSPKPQKTIAVRDSVQHVVSRPPRFSIIQSTLAAKVTFKLDSYSGQVYQLVANSENKESWQALNRLPGLFSDLQIPNSRNYNLFVSTLAIRFTYLINVNTGATWQFVVDPQTKENFFAPMDSN